MIRDDAYQNAEEKVEEARLSRSEELDLSGSYSAKSKLRELPKSLGQLRKLRSLNLSRNHLAVLPEMLVALTHLRSLDLSHNQLTALPDLLAQLTQLESLDVADNQLTTLPDWLGELMQLRSLRLSNNQVALLPKWPAQPKLQSLDLSDNHLFVLPDSLAQFTQLESLDLADNRLTSLPDWLGELMQLHSLRLSYNQLTVLPESLGQLTQLNWLALSNNQLTALPNSFGELKQLRMLFLDHNQLTELPESIRGFRLLTDLRVTNNGLKTLPSWIGELSKLVILETADNQLVDLPESIKQLTSLTDLYLGIGEEDQYLGSEEAPKRDATRDGNPLVMLPDCVRSLSGLRVLWLRGCNLQALPDWLGELKGLDSLQLDGNKLSFLPASLGNLGKLSRLGLNDNPLNPELAAVYSEGVDAVKRYLRELAKGTKKRYEAKLLILGDGNEGKTCVSRAIRGLHFQPQVTTRGVDVEQWRFEHPDHVGDGEKEITLNIWDFEGQEINHQTHQFFLTTQALYLLVFKCRDQFLLDRAEYWLDTIRARAPKAKVAIVVTQCEERTPYVPQDKLYAQYGDLLTDGRWLFAVGCGDNSGILELQDLLKRSAADLEFMGREWPESYSKAEAAIKNKATEGTPHISRGQLYDIFRGCGIDESIFKDLAGAMSILGVMTQFPDCPDLRDFIVLQPQWLTKAISVIMEDKALEADKGEIKLQRMESIWEDRAYAGLFATFHDCMKEFELCYDLEDASRSCLVPLRFGYERPQIPWSTGNGVKERRVEYKLNIRPPMGLMSRFIVKTHHMMATTAEHPKGVYWHNGVFLRTGTGSLASEALCEFDGDARKLRIQVRAAFPQNLLEQIHGYVKAVFSFFSGLEAQRSYGCMKIAEGREGEETCRGMHSESRIYSAIRKQRVLDCEYEFHDVEPQKLIWGFSTFGEYVMAKVASIEELREEWDKKPEWAENLTQDVGKLLGWVEEHSEGLNQLVNHQANLLPEIKQQLELKLHEYLSYTSEMLDDREHTAAPGIISIGTKDRSKWNPSAYFTKTYLLTPFCECEGNIHPCEDGRVEFVKSREWWEKTAPWVAKGTKLLSVGLQLAFAGMPLTLGHDTFEAIKDHVEFMGELTNHMELEANTNEVAGVAGFLKGFFAKDLTGTERESKLMRVALARFLEETAPTNYRARQWGSLRRVRMSDNSYRWMCGTCMN